MNILILDVETTISNKGNPFDLTNKCVCVGLKFTTCEEVIFYKEDFTAIQEYILAADIIVGFNIKFDLSWLKNIGIDISNVRVWDVQLAEFILECQENPYNSLDDAAIKYGFNKKLDIVKTEYWDKDIDTDAIPREILSDYLTQDLVLTQQVYEKQYEQFKNNNRFNLFKLQCADLLVLQEMEWNGVKFNTEKALKKAEEIEIEIVAINKQLSDFVGGIPFNPNSNDDVSCLLYGGNIVDSVRFPIGVFKTGEKVGQVRYKKVDKEYTLPRLVEPIKGTERDKEGYWLVNDTVLRTLKLNKTAKKVVDLLTKYSELDKLRGTYLQGYSKLIDKMNWEKDVLHGTINQCVAITGRTSSSKPNLQNADVVTKLFMESRYL